MSFSQPNTVSATIFWSKIIEITLISRELWEILHCCAQFLVFVEIRKANEGERLPWIVALSPICRNTSTARPGAHAPCPPRTPSSVTFHQH